MLRKLKSLLLDDVVFYALLFVAVGLISFGLGRQSIQNTSQVAAGVQYVHSSSEDDTGEATPPLATTAVVASQSGTKYHLLDCPGAKQIKEANKVTFASIEQAKAAGYGPAANCPGLEQN